MNGTAQGGVTGYSRTCVATNVIAIDVVATDGLLSDVVYNKFYDLYSNYIEDTLIEQKVLRQCFY